MAGDGTKICGLDTTLNLDSRVDRWPMLDVTWTITGRLPTLTVEAFRSAADEAWASWMEVCGVKLHYVDNPNQANILMGIQTIGPGGVLADSQLPGPGTTPQTQLLQRYDTADDFVKSANPPANKIDIGRVIKHEGGHALGLGHLPPGNLLAAMYSTRIDRPQAGDIAEMVARYGMPSAAPPPVKPTDPAGMKELFAYLQDEGGKIFVRSNGAIRPL